jgi:hypothetical protein
VQSISAKLSIFFESLTGPIFEGCYRETSHVIKPVALRCWTRIGLINGHSAVFFSGCPKQQIGVPFQFEGLAIGTCSHFGVDSAAEK